MIRKSVFALLCVGSCVALSAEQEEYCSGPRPMRVGVRYTTPKGIGYQPGYTTLQGFFAPRDFIGKAWLPFLDVRGHVLDNGRWASNVGLGVRYLSGSRLWGVNAYYDYRSSRRERYNQLAAGLEALGRVWDFRINGYFPIGNENNAKVFDNSATFQGNSLMIQYFQRFAMKGANAEVGAHVDHFETAPFYFAAGPYYLTRWNRTAWGGQLRARVDLLHRYLRIEGNTSYDRIFKWIGQVQVSVNIPFGGRSKVAKKKDRSCSYATALNERALQDVDRFEIIPEVKRRVITPAINPATGQPWVF